MTDLTLTLACGHYDRTRALIEGLIHPDGIDLTVLPISNAWARHQRMVLHEEFDAAELSLSSFLMARDRGRAFTAIPVFPYRMFRHSYLWCRSEIRQPSDLTGKRVGVGMYQITTALWLRGHLQHDYGIAASDLRWVTEQEELVPFEPPPGVSLEMAGDRGSPAAGGYAGSSLESRLLDGDIDAYVGVEGVPAGFGGDPRAHRLFSREEEQAYFRRTGIFPIMHLVAFRSSVLEAHPWAAVSLLDAFRAGKAAGREYSRFPRVSSLAWALSYQEEEAALLGTDPYPYDLEPNRHVLQTAVGFAHEQGLIRHQPEVSDLFAPSTVDYPERAG